MAYDLTAPQANIILLAERSAYMDTLTSSRLCEHCSTLWDALVHASNELVFFSSLGFRWGLKLFPSPGPSDADSCYESLGMDVKPSVDTTVLTALAATRPAGAAPATAAFRQAAAFASTLDKAIPTLYLLALGGSPTCTTADPTQEDFASLIDEVQQSAANVFVLGIGSKRAGWDRVAAAGGTISAYRMSNLATLLSDLNALASSTLTCTYGMPAAPSLGQPIDVLLDSLTVPASVSDGYSLSNDQRQLTLNGSYCAGLSGYSTLSIQVGCE